jgi:hypothetical protein
MTWNFNIEDAPKSRTVQVQRLVKSKDSASGEVLKIVDEYVRDDVILESKCGKVIKSYWIPKENRWAGFAQGEAPVAWQEWPKPSSSEVTA